MLAIRVLVGAIVLVLPLLAGCASAPRERAEERPAPAPRAVPLVRGHDGAAASWEELVSAASGADVVLIGENHGHELGLAVAAALWRDVLERSPEAALALEFFERDEQAALDDYLTGLTDEPAFRAAARRTPSNYPPAHRDMVEAARHAGRPVIASNAPRRYVRAARLEGFERLAGLTAEQRRLFRIPDALPEGRYREEFERMMGAMAAGHGGDGGHGAADDAQRAMVEGLLRAQSVWDWSMAESIARALEGGSRPVVQVVGRFHVDFDGGLVQALRAMRPDARVLVLSVVDELPDGRGEADRGRGAFIAYVGPSASPE